MAWGLFCWVVSLLFGSYYLQGRNHEDNNRIVGVLPGESAGKIDCFSKLGSASRVNEMDLISAVLTGLFDHSVLTSPCGKYLAKCSD